MQSTMWLAEQLRGPRKIYLKNSSDLSKEKA
jgi:hypothetical protein